MPIKDIHEEIMSFSSKYHEGISMKKLVVIFASFVLSTGISLANPSSSECGDDSVQPITVSMSQK